ncbi:MAG: BA14K family protein [Hyphomicrobiales bacterium]
MTPSLKNAVIGTLTAVAMSMGVTTVNAQGGMNALASFEAGQSVEQVQLRGRGRGFRGRGFRGRGGRGFGGRGFRGRNIGLGIGAGIASGIIVGSVINSNRGHRSYHNGGGRSTGNQALRRHVAWCAKRYKTYNARTDTFISYKHGKKRCNSPFT